MALEASTIRETTPSTRRASHTRTRDAPRVVAATRATRDVDVDRARARADAARGRRARVVVRARVAVAVVAAPSRARRRRATTRRRARHLRADVRGEDDAPDAMRRRGARAGTDGVRD